MPPGEYRKSARGIGTTDNVSRGLTPHSRRLFQNLGFDYWKLDTGGIRSNPKLESVRLQYGLRF